uniref:C-type lectin domain-containing protein n=2 Tax=Leptobrachium leishanense TaxID=445787 RepID=A0A8C5LS34_9ANUR
MSNDYPDHCFLQPDDNTENNKAFKMSFGFPLPSSRLVVGICTLSTICFVTIIILIVALRNPGEPEADRTLEYTMGNLSVSVNSRIERVSQDGNKIMDKLKEMDTSVQKALSDIAQEKLQADVQRVIRALGRLADEVRKLRVNGTKEEECPSGWSYFSLSCYYVSKIGKSWGDSEKICKAKDSHLVVINSEDEQNFVGSIANQQFTWIGLTDADGEWKWVDGTSYSATPKNWIPGQPDNYFGHGLGGGEDCAHLYSNSEWNDDHCIRSYRYMCEKEL